MQFADNTGPDQPAHLCRLIWAFDVHLQNEWILKYMSMNKECPDQTTWMHMFIWTLAVHMGHKGLFPCCASNGK